MTHIQSEYSINFDKKKRKSKNIKYLIFHYTGMKNEKKAIYRLKNPKSLVSSHYLIKRNGKIIMLVPTLYTAWHAGISSWKKKSLLNKSSIGIEITNPGHQYGYRNFNKKQILSTIKLSKFLIKKFKIKKENILGHSDIAPNRKKDPGEKFQWEFLAKKGVGIWHGLNKKKLETQRKINIDKNKILKFKFNLIKFGYNKELNNNFKTLKNVITAFQRRFRPQIINGKIDLECYEILKNLV